MTLKNYRNHPLNSIRSWGAGLLGVLLMGGVLHAQTFTSAATANATVLTTGLRAGTNGVNFLNVEATSNNANASFGVIDFTAANFGIAYPVTSVNSLSLALTESNAAFSLPVGLAFFITSDTTTSISNVAGASPLKYDTTSTPGGLGTQLTTATSIGSGSFTTTGNVNTGQVDTYTLTLNSTASQLIMDALNNSGTIRLIVEATSLGAATYGGAGQLDRLLETETDYRRHAQSAVLQLVRRQWELG